MVNMKKNVLCKQLVISVKWGGKIFLTLENIFDDVGKLFYLKKMSNFVSEKIKCLL